MPCIPGKNRITCFRTPYLAKGRIIANGKEYWTDIKKDLYKVLKDDAVVVVYDEMGTGMTFQHTEKKFIKSFTKWSGTVEEYLERLAVEIDKKCELIKKGLNFTNGSKKIQQDIDNIIDKGVEQDLNLYMEYGTEVHKIIDNVIDKGVVDISNLEDTKILEDANLIAQAEMEEHEINCDLPAGSKDRVQE
jgi:hypothetical protein